MSKAIALSSTKYFGAPNNLMNVHDCVAVQKVLLFNIVWFVHSSSSSGSFVHSFSYILYNFRFFYLVVSCGIVLELVPFMLDFT